MRHPADTIFAQQIVEDGLASAVDVRHAALMAENLQDLGLRVGVPDVLVARGVLGFGPAETLRKLIARRDGVQVPRSAAADLAFGATEDEALPGFLLERRLASPERMTECRELRRQVERIGLPKRMGEILVDLEVIDAALLESILAHVRSLAKSGELSEKVLPSPEDLALGVVAVDARTIAPEQLCRGVSAQAALAKRTGLRLSVLEVCFGMGLVDAGAANAALDRLRARFPDLPVPAFEPLVIPADRVPRMQKLLHSRKWVPHERIEECEALRKTMEELGIRRKLGEVLVLRGYLPEDRVRRVLGLPARRGAPPPKLWENRPLVAAVSVAAVLLLAVTAWRVAPRDLAPANLGNREPVAGGGPKPPLQGFGVRPADARPFDFAGAWQDAEAAARARRYGEAARLLAKASAERPPEDWAARVGDRLVELLALERALASLREEIRKNPGGSPVFLEQQGECVVVEAEETGLRHRGRSGGDARTTEWSALTPTDLSELCRRWQVGARAPEGLAALCCELALAAGLRESWPAVPEKERPWVRAMAERVFGREKAAEAIVARDVEPPKGTETPNVKRKAGPGAEDEKLPPVPALLAALDAYEAACATVPELIREARFRDAAKALAQAVPATTEPEVRAFFTMWQGALDRLSGLPDRIARGLAARKRPLDGARLGIEPAEGVVRAVNAEGLELSVNRAVLELPWKRLSWKSWDTLILETAEADGAVLRALLAFEREQGEGEVAALDGSDLAAYRAARARLDVARQGRRALATVRELLGQGQRRAAFDRFAQIDAALLSEPLRALRRELAAEVRQAFAGAAEEEARARAGDDPAAAAALAEAAAARLPDGPGREALSGLAAGLRREAEYSLGEFEPDDPESQRFSGHSTAFALERREDRAREGVGGGHWTIAAGESGGVRGAVPEGLKEKYEYLSFWTFTERGAVTIDVRFACADVADTFGTRVDLPASGWKRHVLRLGDLQGTQKAEWDRVQELVFWHFDDQPAAELWLDCVRLHRKDPAGGPAAGGTGPASGGDGRTTAASGTAAGTGSETTAASTRPPVRAHGGPAASLGAKHYVNVELGFAFVPPNGWEGVPAPKEVQQRFQGDVRFRPVIRFKRKSGPDEMVDLYWVPEAAELAAALELYRTTPGLGSNAAISPANVKIGGHSAATFWHKLRLDLGATVGIVAGFGEAFIFRFVAFGEKPEESFLKCIRSFVFLNDEQRTRLAKAGKSGALPPGWGSFQTAHYDIQYDTDDEFARELGKHLEAILVEYQRRFPMDPKTGGWSERFTVKVFKKKEAFDSYAEANGVTGAAAYFSPAQNELVCYKTVDEGRKKTFHIIYHEASHQYLHLYMGRDVQIPIWLNEGVAEVFYGGEFGSDGKLKIGENRERILEIKEAIRQRREIPLARIFEYTQKQFYADAQLCYAEGWSIAYFLWNTKDARFRGLLDRFYAVLKESGEKDQAFAETFGKVDLDAMEDAWRKFVLGL